MTFYGFRIMSSTFEKRFSLDIVCTIFNALKQWSLRHTNYDLLFIISSHVNIPQKPTISNIVPLSNLSLPRVFGPLRRIRLQRLPLQRGEPDD